MRSGESSVATQMRLEPLPATRSSARRDDIQGLRAIAVLAVISFHAGLGVSGGFVGVDMFFVISGYVITLMLAREWAAHGRIRFLSFRADPPPVTVWLGVLHAFGAACRVVGV